jgi:enamine deaminase RidA (YjgF/YER057c/UK114 family)
MPAGPKYHNPDVVSVPISAFSMLATGGDHVFLAGLPGINKDNGVVGPDIERQTRAALENVRLSLASQGATLADLVKLVVSLTDPADVDGFTAARDDYFAEHLLGSEPPTTTLLAIDGLVWPALKIEIDGWAHRRRDGADDGDSGLRLETSRERARASAPTADVVVERHGDVVFVGGALGIAADGSVSAGEDIGSQTIAAYENLRRSLAEEEAALRDVAKLIVSITTRDDVKAFYEARDAYFAENLPAGEYPPNTLLIVEDLGRPGAKVEIDAWAYSPR